jgi:hypothetical protein
MDREKNIGDWKSWGILTGSNLKQTWETINWR